MEKVVTPKRFFTGASAYRKQEKYQTNINRTVDRKPKKEKCPRTKV